MSLTLYEKYVLRGKILQKSYSSVTSTQPSTNSTANCTIAVTNSSLNCSNSNTTLVKVKDLYEPGFLLVNQHICLNKTNTAQILILVTSAVDHFSNRNIVRKTWGNYKKHISVQFGFFIGRTFNMELQQKIEAEQRLYGDIIQGRNIDSYKNLTLKTISMLEWTHNFCPGTKFILKTDDDMFINVSQLLIFLSKIQNSNNTIYGRATSKWIPFRDTKSKYFVSKEIFPPDVFPDFTTGPAYLLTRDTILKIYKLALEKTFIVLEDVLVTGIVAEELGIKRVKVNGFVNEKIKRPTVAKIKVAISLHGLPYFQKLDFWKKIH